MIPNILALVRSFLMAFAPSFGGAVSAEISVTVAEFRQLSGWQEEDRQSALWVFYKRVLI